MSRQPPHPSIEAAMAGSADGLEPIPVWTRDGGAAVALFNGQAYRTRGPDIGVTHDFMRALVGAWRDRNSPATRGAPVVSIEDFAGADRQEFYVYVNGVEQDSTPAQDLAAAESAARLIVSPQALAPA